MELVWRRLQSAASLQRERSRPVTRLASLTVAKVGKAGLAGEDRSSPAVAETSRAGRAAGEEPPSCCCRDEQG